MSSKSKKRRNASLTAAARGGPPAPDKLFSTPETKRIRDEAIARGVAPFAVLLETLGALGDATGMPIQTRVIGDTENTAKVTHLADQLAAEALARLPK
jgi:hypothetical protein